MLSCPSSQRIRYRGKGSSRTTSSTTPRRAARSVDSASTRTRSPGEKAMIVPSSTLHPRVAPRRSTVEPPWRTTPTGPRDLDRHDTLRDASARSPADAPRAAAPDRHRDSSLVQSARSDSVDRDGSHSCSGRPASVRCIDGSRSLHKGKQQPDLERARRTALVRCASAASRPPTACLQRRWARSTWGCDPQEAEGEISPERWFAELP